MKRILSLVFLLILITSSVFATSVGTGIGVDIETEDFAPLLWMCDHRVVSDDAVGWGRTSMNGQEMFERQNNYAFEGESIALRVLVMDKNGIEKLENVFMTIGDAQGSGNDIEVNCQKLANSWSTNLDSCNARILEEEIEFELENEEVATIDRDVMAIYNCEFTVETPDSMYGEYWLSVEAVDLDGLSATVDENEFWFLNPVIGLTIDGDLVFENVRPGVNAYSDTLLIGNNADYGSGVMLDMFISGTSFYDSSSSGVMCPTSNVLELSGAGEDGARVWWNGFNFLNGLDDTGLRYFAANGGYSTYNDVSLDLQRYDRGTTRFVDNEGYVNIQNGDHWDKSMYDEAEIIQAATSSVFRNTNLKANAQTVLLNSYFQSNLLAPGSEMTLTFKLVLPEPCNGDFDSGQIYFWGEAI